MNELIVFAESGSIARIIAQDLFDRFGTVWSYHCALFTESIKYPLWPVTQFPFAMWGGGTVDNNSYEWLLKSKNESEWRFKIALGF